MEIKALEIRDEGTCVAVFAVRMYSEDNPVHVRYLNREGYPPDGSSIAVFRASNLEGTNDPYGWKGNQRTIPNAHNWIIDHWFELKDGDVVDVRVVLGEAQTPVAAEIWRL